MIVEAWQVQNLQGRLTGWRPREELQFACKGCLLVEFLLARGRSGFFVVRSSTDWMRLTYIMECNQLSSESTDLNVNLIAPHHPRYSQNIQNV